MKRPFTLIVVALMQTTAAYADLKPKDAAPMSADEIRRLYADHTAVFGPKASAFFGADGKVKGLANGGAFAGVWEVKGNELCMNTSGFDKKTKTFGKKLSSDCWQWVKSGDVSWTLYSKAWDNKKQDLVKGWYKEDHLKAGDLVSEKFKAIVGN